MKKPRTTIRKRMIFYFLLIALANIFVAGEIIYEMKSEDYRNRVVTKMYQVEQGVVKPEVIYDIIDEWIKKFSVMIGVLITVSAVILFLFVVQIASPLHYMIKQAVKMSEGDLSGMIKVHTNDELAEMAMLVNDMSQNLQEVLAQLERISDDMQATVLLHSRNINRHSKLPAVFKKETMNLHKIQQDMILLKSSFKLYRINFNETPKNEK
ncbi:MAG: HAMP domain-containing protein [Spirochaetes bacterium]|jgi:signal transduction histidine kinase|nr:HAMP domain-containing protein [Spirochaetota bacterium]